MFIPRRARVAAGCIVSAIGGLWALQGIGLVPGSFMSGDPVWFVIGVVTVAIGCAVVLLAYRAAH
jgi:hypothetical protein